jgi:hypothetical protein
MKPKILQEEAEVAEKIRGDWQSLLPLLPPVQWIGIA